MNARLRTFVALSMVALLTWSCAETPPRPPPPSIPITSTSPSPEPRPTRIAAVGDVGEANPTQAAIASAILGEHRDNELDALLVLGDIVYPNGDPNRFDEQFWRAFAPIAEAGVPIIAVLGNHDIETDRRAMMSKLGMTERYYERVIGRVQLLGLDTSTAELGSEQAAWLEQRLSAPGPRWRIPFMHVGPYSSGMHGDHPALTSGLVPILRAHDVQLVLSAHDHNYERMTVEGIIYLVSGGGCCPRVISAGPRTEASSSEPHFIVIEAHTEWLSLRARAADGRVIDDATLGVRELSGASTP